MRRDYLIKPLENYNSNSFSICRGLDENVR